MRTITGTLTEPDFDNISGRFLFTAEQSSASIPVTSTGEIAIVSGAYSGDIADGVYTVVLQYLDSVSGSTRNIQLGTGVGIIAGAAVDILTLIGLSDIPDPITQLAIDQAITDHNAAFTHDDIAHANRVDLDLVSGTNTGDQYKIPGQYDIRTDLTATNAGTVTLDYSLGNAFKIDASSLTSGQAFTIAISNWPAGVVFSALSLQLTVGAAADLVITWPTGVIAPTLTASKRNRFILSSWDNGTTVDLDAQEAL